ncbi:MAG: HigA family addiction module antitoxin [Alphaproteobacteria bacterium]|nr:HigA family addiction module antitoxin [Alphaproteobacteria bacterium]
MFRRNRKPTAPGLILRSYYLDPRNLSINRFSKAAGLTRKHVSNIVNGHAGITSDTAYRFSQVLGTTPQFWLNLQNAIDLYETSQRLSSWRPAEVHPSEVAAQ